ncbi:MAG: DUF1579 domain-containing protein [Bacteroidetes bacterium]|nr:DUF1579 domain-containing protein [Bacteroidota bacterium]
MKSILNIFFLLLSLSLINSPIIAQEEMPEMTPEQKVWIDYMTPGWAHNMMAKSVGEWKTETSFWQSPGAEPVKSEGSVNNKMILGGRYLHSEHSGNAWGMEMNGISTTAFDNTTEEFLNTWIDNLGTGLAFSKGKYDKENNTVNFLGKMVDPMAGKEVEFKQVLKFIDDNTQMFEMYLFDDGKEFKMIEMKSTKK